MKTFSAVVLVLFLILQNGGYAAAQSSFLPEAPAASSATPPMRDAQLEDFLQQRKKEEAQKPKTNTDQLEQNSEFLQEKSTIPAPPGKQNMPFRSTVLLTDLANGKQLSKEPAIQFVRNQSAPANSLSVVIDPKLEYQKMSGAGASMTESSAWLLSHKLSPDQRAKLMRQLYSPIDGIGLSMTRLPMGATDFALNNYTYNDLPSSTADIGQKKFSIGRDYVNGIVPLVRQAQSLNADHKVMSTPWSAPRWMKVNASTDPRFPLSKGQLNPTYYDSYSAYFAKYIDAYQRAGIDIYGISSQNEPRYEAATYPSMSMTAPAQASFIKNHLGPELTETKSPKLFTWEHNWDGIDYPLTVLGDTAAKNYIYGTTFHCYGGEESRQALLQRLHPDKAIYFTECTGFDEPALSSESDFRWGMRHIVINNVRNWGQSIMYWNIALDQNHGPRNVGTTSCPTCRGLAQINTTNGATTFTPEYYILGQYSKEVKPNAKRIASTTYGEGSIETVAFKNPDGGRVLIALNSGVSAKQMIVREGGDSFVYTLPPSAAATFRWSQPPTDAPNVNNSYYEAEHFDQAQGGVTIRKEDDGGPIRYISLPKQAHVSYRDVELTNQSALAVRYKTNSATNVDIRIDTADGPLLTTARLEATKGAWKRLITNAFTVGGPRTLYLVNNGPADISVDWFSPTNAASSAPLDRSKWRAYGVRATESEYPALVLDGNSETRWSTNAAMTYGHWFMVDLGRTTALSSLSVNGTRGDYPRKVLAEGSDDGLHFFPLAEIIPSQNQYDLHFTPTAVRYIRLVQTSDQPDIGQWFSIGELNAYLKTD